MGQDGLQEYKSRLLFFIVALPGSLIFLQQNMVGA